MVVLTGAGRAFSAGGDFPWLLEGLKTRTAGKLSSYEAKRVVFNLLECEKPVICRMNGDAIGLGATLALFWQGREIARQPGAMGQADIVRWARAALARPR